MALGCSHLAGGMEHSPWWHMGCSSEAWAEAHTRGMACCLMHRKGEAFQPDKLGREVGAQQMMVLAGQLAQNLGKLLVEEGVAEQPS